VNNSRNDTSGKFWSCIFYEVKTDPSLWLFQTCFRYEGKTGDELKGSGFFKIIFLKGKPINNDILKRPFIDRVLDRFIFKTNQITLFPFFMHLLTQNRWAYRGAFDSAKNHKRQGRKRQSVTAKREKSQTPKFV